MSNLERPRILVVVDTALAPHVVDMLATAGVTAIAARIKEADHVRAVVVSDDMWERATATIDLVFPGMRPAPATPAPRDVGTTSLSDRMIRRTDWTPGPPDLLDGRAAFASTSGSAPPPDSAPTASGGTSGSGDIDDFVPAPPAPLPSTDAITRFAWLAAVGGPVLLILSAVFSLGGMATTIGLLAFIGGFVFLVARMPDKAGRDEGWDDGAVL